MYKLACNLPRSSDEIDVNAYARDLTEIYKSVIDEYMPLKKKTRKQIRFGKKPWLSQGLRTSIDKKDELYDLSKKDPTFIEKYKSHSNLLRKLIKKAMYEYDKQKFADYGHDKAKTWQHVNEIMKRKRKARSSIKKIRNKEGEDISDLEGIANCLNEHFSSVGKNMAEKHDKN